MGIREIDCTISGRTNRLHYLARVHGSAPAQYQAHPKHHLHLVWLHGWLHVLQCTPGLPYNTTLCAGGAPTVRFLKPLIHPFHPPATISRGALQLRSAGNKGEISWQMRPAKGPPTSRCPLLTISPHLSCAKKVAAAMPPGSRSTISPELEIKVPTWFDTWNVRPVATPCSSWKEWAAIHPIHSISCLVRPQKIPSMPGVACLTHCSKRRANSDARARCQKEEHPKAGISITQCIRPPH
ncbi:hypothetical protein V8C26DRAFT_57547 [Trichoderma gracile]